MSRVCESRKKLAPLLHELRTRSYLWISAEQRRVINSDFRTEQRDKFLPLPRVRMHGQRTDYGPYLNPLIHFKILSTDVRSTYIAFAILTISIGFVKG